MISWPYIAGFFDGEGCISHTGRYFIPKVSIVQTGDRGREVLTNIYEFLTHRKIRCRVILKTRAATAKPHYKPCYALTILAQADIKLFLEGVVPYLHVKRISAQDTLRIFKIFPGGRGVKNSYAHFMGRETVMKFNHTPEIRAKMSAGMKASHARRNNYKIQMMTNGGKL